MERVDLRTTSNLRQMLRTTRVGQCGAFSPQVLTWICGQINPSSSLLLELTTLYTRLVELFSAFNIRHDGTRVFVSPIGDKGVLPLVALDDIGWWARYIFDNAPSTTGKTIKLASQLVTYPDIVDTFKRVTGLPAEYKSLTMDEYFALWNGKVPLASAEPNGQTWEENFRAFFALWRDNITTRDMDWIQSIHPPTTLEQWMRDHQYDGRPTGVLLKDREDGRNEHHLISEKISQL